jgi:hypothetical protein
MVRHRDGAASRGVPILGVPQAGQVGQQGPFPGI